MAKRFLWLTDVTVMIGIVFVGVHGNIAIAIKRIDAIVVVRFVMLVGICVVMLISPNIVERAMAHVRVIGVEVHTKSWWAMVMSSRLLNTQTAALLI